MVVAGRVVAGDGADVAIMMVEAEATENTIELVAGGATAPTEEIVAAGPRGRQAVPAQRCARRSRNWPRKAAKPVADFPVFPPYQDDVLRGRRRRPRRPPGWPTR